MKHVEAQTRRAAVLAQAEAAQSARAAELAGRWQADFAIPFLAEERVDSEEVRETRALFTDARQWKAYCEHRWPDLDSERQRQLKLAENREARPSACGEEHWRTLPTGEVKKSTWQCGLCDPCRTRQARLFRRALDEIMGVALPAPGSHPTPAELIKALAERLSQGFAGRKEPVRVIGPGVEGLAEPATEPVAEPAEAYLKPTLLELLEQLPDPEPKAAPETLGRPDRRGEPAPPLARVPGPLNLLTVETEQERLSFTRKLRRQGVRYRCFPVEKEGLVAYDFIVNSDSWGDPLAVMISEPRLKRWAVGVSGKRASGDLLPCLKELEARYREPLPYEVVCPELDEQGRPVDPDLFCLALPGIGTATPLPEVAVEFEVNSPESLQAALLAIHKAHLAFLTRRGAVIYGVSSYKKFYTRYLTLPSLLQEFNQKNEAIKAAWNLKRET